MKQRIFARPADNLTRVDVAMMYLTQRRIKSMRGWATTIDAIHLAEKFKAKAHRRRQATKASRKANRG